MMYVTEILQARSVQTHNHTYINPFHGVEVSRLAQLGLLRKGSV